jgi:hypothetical protein
MLSELIATATLTRGLVAICCLSSIDTAIAATANCGYQDDSGAAADTYGLKPALL